MAPPLDARRLIRESAPVAVILLFWVALSSIGGPVIGGALLYAGLAMALLYVVVRGIALARQQPPSAQPDTVEGLVRENVRVAIPAGAWFLAAKVVFFVEHTWDTLGIPGLFTSPADSLAFVLSRTGVAVVLLYAIAIGLPRARGYLSGYQPDPTESSTGDGWQAGSR